MAARRAAGPIIDACAVAQVRRGRGHGWRHRRLPRARLGQLRRRRRAAAAARRRGHRQVVGHRPRAALGGQRRGRVFVLLPSARRVRHRRPRGLDCLRRLHRHRGHRRRARLARGTARGRSAGGPEGDRAAVPGAAGGVRTRQRGGSGAAKRAAQSRAARRPHAQPAHAAHRHQGGRHRADPVGAVAPAVRAVDRRPPGVAGGDRRGVGSLQSLHRRAVELGPRPSRPSRCTCAPSRWRTSCGRAWRAPKR